MLTADHPQPGLHEVSFQAAAKLQPKNSSCGHETGDFFLARDLLDRTSKTFIFRQFGRFAALPLPVGSGFANWSVKQSRSFATRSFATRSFAKGMAMLVLSRKKDESIVINDNITIVVVEIRGDKVRLGVEAPKEVPVHRREVFEAIARGEPVDEPPLPNAARDMGREERSSESQP